MTRLMLLILVLFGGSFFLLLIGLWALAKHKRHRRIWRWLVADAPIIAADRDNWMDRFDGWAEEFDRTPHNDGGVL